MDAIIATAATAILVTAQRVCSGVLRSELSPLDRPTADTGMVMATLRLTGMVIQPMVVATAISCGGVSSELMEEPTSAASASATRERQNFGSCAVCPA